LFIDKDEFSKWRTLSAPAGNTKAAPGSKTTSSVASSTTPPPVHVPRALGTYQQRDAEEEERERGNTEFKNGNFTAAVKSYTKCLGLKGKNYVAFSNRAMAYLKLKEYARAVVGIICKCICDFFW
jgi:Flp pilus assembly protein TadD